MRYNGLPADLFFLAVPEDFFRYIFDVIPANRRMFYRNAKSKLPMMAIVSSRSFFKADYKHIKKIALQYIKDYIKSPKDESKRK
jgi:hypothetical protein